MAVTLEWVRDNYDANKDGYIDHDESMTARTDYFTHKTITGEQVTAVIRAYNDHTKLPAYTTPQPTAAKGRIVNFSYPTNVKNGERISVRAAVQNTGGSTGTFELQLFVGYTQVAQSLQFNVESGRTGPTKTVYVNAPPTGGRVSYQLMCVRIV